MTSEVATKEKKQTKKNVDFIGNELASISERLLIVENRLSNLQDRVSKVSKRMGLE